MPHEPQTVSGLEKSQPLMEEITQHDATAIPSREDKQYSDAGEILMESPSDEKAPCANASMSLAALSAAKNEKANSKCTTVTKADATALSERNATRPWILNPKP